MTARDPGGDMQRDENERSPWTRSDELRLTAAGVDAEAAYRSTIVAARESAGRASFDAAREQWAAERSLEPEDGVYLGELSAGPLGFSAVVAALETSGKTRADAKSALARLIRDGYVEIVR